MRRIFTLIIFYFLISSYNLYADIIAQQDFETTPATPTLTYTNSGGLILTGSMSGGRPINSPYYSSGSRGMTRTNGTATITSNTIDVSNYTNISLSYNLASLSNTIGNGADETDYAAISISIDGGLSWIEQSRVTGNTGSNNTCWAFTDGRSAIRTYATSTYTKFNPGYNNYDNPSNGYSNVIVNDIPSTNELQVRIVLFNNAGGEIWTIDNIIISGEAASSKINLSRSNTDDFSYAFGAGPSAVDTFRVWGDSLVPMNGYLGLKASTNFEISTSASGPFTDTLSLAYTDSTLSSTTIYVRMISGLGVNVYSGSVTASGGDAANKSISIEGIVTAGPCGDLIISEYVLGTSNNKYIEIYNPTSSTITLNSGGTNFYRLGYYANGASIPSFINFSSGASIPPYGTYVIGHGSGTIFTDRDQTFGLAFNGNDAISLQRNFSGIWQNIDVIGEIGIDPGTSWTVGGNTTVGTTLVRKPSVVEGSLSASGFPKLGTEWIAYPSNESHTLGSHANICQTPDITYIDNLSVTTICPGETMTVDFSTLGTYTAGNTFTAQLSNSSGFFTTSTNIGTLSRTGTNPTGTINVTIPPTATASSNYHIRVISSNPVSGSLISQQELTINSAIPPVVTLPSATQEDNATTLSWKNPSTGCWEQTMVVISTNPSFTFTPTGNGSAYIANSIYSSGTQVVFKDTGSSVNITGLNNGTVYYLKVFTRNGTNWSVAVNYEFLVDPYCYPKYTGICDEYISRVSINTLDNITAEGCGYKGYSWHANQTTTLVREESYELTVQVGKVGIAADESYGGDDLRVWVDWNGNGTFSPTEKIIEKINGGGSGTFNITVPPTAALGNIRLRVQLFYYDISDPFTACGTTFKDGETEDYTLNIVPTCIPTTSTFKFYPTEGSAGTEVRFIKTSGASAGFLSVDSIYFNGVKATSFRILDDNTMFAIVPDGAGSGTVKLFDNSPCRRTSTITFNYLNKDGYCGLYTDLFISEVFDTVGNTHYIEIFNGTNTTINLSTPYNYSIRILNKSSYTDSKPTAHNINITGSIPAGENRVYYAGSTGTKTSGTQSSNGAGFNAYDDVLLLKDGNILDVFTAPTYEKFNYRRKNTVTGPSTTYTAADWTNTPFNSSDIGKYIPLVSFSITTHPSDVSGCKIDLTTTATGSGLSYQWFYNDNLTNDIVWKVADSLEILFPLCVVTGAATNHLVVTGDLSQFENYQFYCKVTKTTCSEFSNVARFKILPDPYFRSKQSGDWRLASTWQTSPTGTGSWINACTFPWDSNSVSVEILNGHTIDIINDVSTPDVQIDQLRILTGGQLKIAPTAELYLNNGTGTDLFVQGTLYDQGTGGGGNGMTFLGTAKWILDANGTIIKTGSTSVLDYKNNYEGGISSVPATANWIYRKETTVTPTIVTNDMYYPNLYFEDTYIGSASYICTGNTDFMTVKGSLYVGDTGKVVYVSNNNNYTTPMRVLGNVKIGAGSIYRISASPIGTGIEIAGNITNEGTFDVNHLSTGLLRLNGSLDQTISGKGVFDIWNMELDKVAQTQVILDTNIDVKNQLKFVGGIVNTKANILTVSNGDPSIAIIGFDAPNGTGIYSNDNYVIGKLRRSIGLANNIYIFPIGDTVSKMGYNPSSLTIRAIPGSSPYAIGEFIPQWPGTINTYRVINYCGGLNFIEYRGFACNSYWKYEGSIFSNYDIYIHPNVSNPNVRPNEETNLGHTKTYRALKEVSSQAGLTWNPDASEYGNACIVSNNFYSIIGSGYTGFSIFSPGGGNGNTTALPVQLLYFNVECISDIPTLKWATASELNSDYFTLEKSSDGNQFNPIANINAAGNSNQKIEYTYKIPSSEIDNYYRLVETDFDGSKYYHGIRSLDCKTTYNNSYVYYQPNQGITAQFNTNQIPISIEVFDASGRLMSKEIINKNLNKHFVSSSTNWAKGVYFVRMLYGNNEIKSEKVAIY